MTNNSKQQMHTKYRPDIDGLRAVAVLSVVVFHAFPKWLTGGFAGVDVFFVISGYLISTVLFENINSENFTFSDFYSRRVRRIFPALLTVLIFCMVLGWFVLLDDEYKQLGSHIAAGVGFYSNLMLWSESGYFDVAAETKPLLHLWSLGIEEQFYIFYPIILLLSWKKRINQYWIILSLFGISFILNIYGIKKDAVSVFYSPLTRIWELLVGSLLSWITLHRGSLIIGLNKNIRNFSSLVGAALLMSSFVMLTKDSIFPGWWAVLPVFGAALIIYSGTSAWLNSKVLSNRVFVWFGVISYPLYLWHWPLLSYARIIEGNEPSKYMRILLVTISILMAWMTYKYIERPLRFGFNSKLKVIFLSVSMAFVAALGVGIYEADGLKFRSVVKINLMPPHAINVGTSNPAVACVEHTSHTIANKLCEKYERIGAHKTIVMWGDSTTGAWLPVFQYLSKERNFNIINILQRSCPPILEARKTKFEYEKSRSYCSDGKNQRDAIELIKEIKPDLIFLMGAWNGYSEFSNREFVTDRSDEQADQVSTKRTIIKRLPETLLELSKIGKTIVFTSWPLLPETPFNRRIVAPDIQGKKEEVTASAQEFRKQSELFNNIFSSMTNEHVVLFNPAEKVCGNEYCLSIAGGVLMYDDLYHISPLGAMSYRDDINALIDW